MMCGDTTRRSSCWVTCVLELLKRSPINGMCPRIGILLFTQAAQYYMSCTVPLVLLGLSRPRIAMALMGALMAWAITLLAHGESARAFAWCSAIALALAAYVLLEVARNPGASEAPAPTPQSAST